MNKVSGKMKCYQHFKQSQSLCILETLPFHSRAGRVVGRGALATGIFFFQPPYRHDMGKLVRRWPSLASMPQLAFPWAVCPGVRRLWRVSGSLTGRRGQGGLSGSCYLPGGVEVLVSSESAGSHRWVRATCLQVQCWAPVPCAIRGAILWSLPYYSSLSNEETGA